MFTFKVQPKEEKTCSIFSSEHTSMLHVFDSTCPSNCKNFPPPPNLHNILATPLELQLPSHPAPNSSRSGSRSPGIRFPHRQKIQVLLLLIFVLIIQDFRPGLGRVVAPGRRPSDNFFTSTGHPRTQRRRHGGPDKT